MANDEEWEQEVLDAVVKGNVKLTMVSEFRDRVRRVMEKPGNKKSELFVNGFCAKLVSEILKLNRVPENQEFVKEFLCISAELYGQVMMGKPENDFGKEAKRMLTDVSAPFYRATSATRASTKKSPSVTYQDCLKSFVMSGSVANALELIKRNRLGINDVVWMVILCYRNLAYVGQGHLVQLCKAALAFVFDKLGSLDEKTIRLMNNEDMSEFVLALKTMMPSESTQISEFRFQLAIVFVKSPFLEKQFTGLSELRKILSRAGSSALRKCRQLKESGVNRLIRSAYNLLNLETYFTTGPDETRAWTYTKGTKAPQAAGIIHTDFERGFIRAEVIKYDDYVTLGSEKACREAGKIAIEGKEYVVQDGDVMHFRFNV